MPDLRGSTPLRILDFGGGDGSLAVAIAKHLQSRGKSVPIMIDLVDYCEPRDPEDPHASSRSLTFRHRGDQLAALRRFLACYAILYLIDSIVLWVFASQVGVRYRVI